MKKYILYFSLVISSTFVGKLFSQDLNFSSEYNKITWPIAMGINGGIAGDDGNYKRIAIYHGGSISLQTGTNNPNINNSRLYIDAIGNVGMGTNNPASLLHLNKSVNNLSVTTDLTLSQFNGFSRISGLYTGTYMGGIAFSTNNYSSGESDGNIVYHERMRITANGNVGIGTTNPRSPLEVTSIGDNRSVQSGLIIQQYNPGSPNNSAGISLDFGIGNNSGNNNIVGRITFKETWWAQQPKLFFSLWDENNNMQDRMVVDTYGNVGIGTTSPDAKLAVTGQVHAQEVKVSIAVPGPDYVFEKGYKMPILDSIKNYIDQNKHLPEVPSAKEMEKDGIQLGEMNMLLLKKIEELTLYLIEQQKQNEQQQREIETLKQKIK